MVKVTIDRLECISCEACWTACPEVFEQNPEDEFSEITEQYRTNDNPAEGECLKTLPTAYGGGLVPGGDHFVED